MDAVILWVDGSDPRHAAKRAAALGHLGGAAPRAAGDPTRFDDRGEIYFCIASVLQNAPFIRRIHVVTDDQQPPLLERFFAENLCAPDFIRVVDHRELFRNHLDHLPTFNVRTLEALLGEIHGLAPVFLYLNDDFFINAPLTEADLVTAGGLLRISARWQKAGPILRRHRIRALAAGLRRGRPRAGFSLAQARSAEILKLRHTLAFDHSPRVLRRDTLGRWYAAHPEVLECQLRYRFRDPAQHSPYVLAGLLELAAGTAVLESPGDQVFLTPTNAQDDHRQLAWIRDGSVTWGCVQSLDLFAAERRAKVLAALRHRFASKLPAGLRSPAAAD